MMLRCDILSIDTSKILFFPFNLSKLLSELLYKILCCEPMELFVVPAKVNQVLIALLALVLSATTLMFILTYHV